MRAHTHTHTHIRTHVCSYVCTFRILNLQQDNTLLRNFIAESNIDSPKSQPKCSVCAKSAASTEQEAPTAGADSTLLLTLNKQLQQQLQQAQLQLQQQQRKSKDMLEQQHMQAKVWGVACLGDMVLYVSFGLTP